MMAEDRTASGKRTTCGWMRWLPTSLASILWRGPTSRDLVALTFDDGPHPVFTDQILQILHRHQVRATFFPLGCHAQQYPDIIRQMSAEGHVIGNHTYGHRTLVFVPHQVAHQEISQGSDIIEQITAVRPCFFRPPRGLVGWNGLLAACQLGMRTVLWSSSPRDWTTPGVRQIVQRVLARARPGAIVLLHDAKYDDLDEDRSQTVRALPAIIEGLRKRGYRLATLAELVAAPPSPGEVPQ